MLSVATLLFYIRSVIHYEKVCKSICRGITLGAVLGLNVTEHNGVSNEGTNSTQLLV